MQVFSKTILMVFLVGAELGSIVTFTMTRSSFCEPTKEQPRKDFFDKSKIHIKIGDEQVF